jgi:hypothetical protein
MSLQTNSDAPNRKASAKAYKNTGNNTRYAQNDEVVSQTRGAHDEHSHEDLSHVVENSSGYADPHGGEHIGFLKESHAEKAEKTEK